MSVSNGGHGFSDGVVCTVRQVDAREQGTRHVPAPRNRKQEGNPSAQLGRHQVSEVKQGQGRGSLIFHLTFL